jgi:EmrB/QacA subfamily drug resistance transporter
MVAVGVLISTMDSSMINVALPSIMRSFSTSLAVSQLVVLVYLSVITITLVLWGYLSDSYGKGKIYLFGVLTFAVAAVGSSIASSFPQLVVMRCFQGAGAAMMMSSGPAIIKMVFPPDQLGRGLGLVGLATSCGLMSGPVISGLLIRYFSWRGVFLVTLPLSLSVYIVGHFYLSLDKNEKCLPVKRAYDWVGFVLWGAAILLFILLISFYETMERKMIGFTLFGLISVIGLFSLYERRVPQPLLPYTLFQRRYFATASITAALSFAVLFMVILLIPFYLDYVLQLPADRIGLVMLTLPSSLVIVSPAAGWIYDHIGARIPTTLGLGISCLAVLTMTGLNDKTSIAAIAIALSVLGAGQALFLSPNSASILAKVEEHYVGVASGILATARNLGMLIGAGLSGAVFSFVFAILSGGRNLHGFRATDVPEFLGAIHWTFFLAAVLSLTGCLLSALRDG